MGLDNGLILRIEDKNLKIPNWLYRLKSDFFSKQYDEYEIYYWRKCYDIRQNLMDKLDNFITNEGCKVSLNEFNCFKDEIIYRYFTIPGIKSWNDSGMNCWEYSFFTFRQGLYYLYIWYKLKRFISKHTDSCILYFYDSF